MKHPVHLPLNHPTLPPHNYLVQSIHTQLGYWTHGLPITALLAEHPLQAWFISSWSLVLPSNPPLELSLVLPAPARGGDRGCGLTLYGVVEFLPGTPVQCILSDRGVECGFFLVKHVNGTQGRTREVTAQFLLLFVVRTPDMCIYV